MKLVIFAAIAGLTWALVQYVFHRIENAAKSQRPRRDPLIPSLVLAHQTWQIALRNAGYRMTRGLDQVADLTHACELLSRARFENLLARLADGLDNGVPAALLEDFARIFGADQLASLMRVDRENVVSARHAVPLYAHAKLPEEHGNDVRDPVSESSQQPMGAH